MRRLAVYVIAITIVLGGIIWVGSRQNVITYEAQTIEVVKTVEVETLAVRVQKAQDEARASAEAAAKEAYDKAYGAAMLEVELAETAKYRKEIEAKEAELEKKSSF